MYHTSKSFGFTVQVEKTLLYYDLLPSDLIQRINN